jgi:hypothetical protein
MQWRMSLDGVHSRSANMPSTARFVILEHDHPMLHWDFMLEWGGVLRTWRLPAPPANGDMIAEQIGDHRLAYLVYEGPVSGGRGTVKCWDRGAYQMEKAGIDELKLAVFGGKIRAILTMTRLTATTWQAFWGIYPFAARSIGELEGG